MKDEIIIKIKDVSYSYNSVKVLEEDVYKRQVLNRLQDKKCTIL